MAKRKPKKKHAGRRADCKVVHFSDGRVVKLCRSNAGKAKAKLARAARRRKQCRKGGRGRDKHLFVRC